MRQVFTTGDVAQICMCSQHAIICAIDTGRLKGFRVPGSRHRRVTRAELQKYMTKHDIPFDIDGKFL